MKTLYIDTHLRDINVILFDNIEIIKQEKIVDKKQNSMYLMPSIKKVCDNEKIDEIVVVNGPGSFTGVRLGVTVAKTLAYTWNIPIKTITSLDQIALSCNNDIVGLSDGNGYFIGKYKDNKAIEYFYLKNEEYKTFIKENQVITDVFIDYTKVLNYLREVKNINPHAVKPIYIKLIGVENDKNNQK